LVELMISLCVLALVLGYITSGMIQVMRTQGTMQNRTEMHSNVRNATELIQQEVGQAGRITLPTDTITNGTTLTAAAAAGATALTVHSATGMFCGMYLDVDTGANYEFVQISPTAPCISGTTLTLANATTFPHAITPTAAPVQVSGGFASGIVPPASSYTYNGYSGPYLTNGSSGSVLKLYGDINRDGSVRYVEYVCSQGTPSAPGYLYRNVTPGAINVSSAASKVTSSTSTVLLTNLLLNPPNATTGLTPPCFVYQMNPTAGSSGNNYVIDVAVTLTVQTQQVDMGTSASAPTFQQETKALLNVSPRNVFDVWRLDIGTYPEKIQPIPPNITTYLLPGD
jgi:hypothetical protein